MTILIGLSALLVVIYIANKTLPCGDKHNGVECCNRKHKDGEHWGIVRKNGIDTQVFW